MTYYLILEQIQEVEGDAVWPVVRVEWNRHKLYMQIAYFLKHFRLWEPIWNFTSERTAIHISIFMRFAKWILAQYTKYT